MKNNSKKKSGFTLLEIIISMMIIGILSISTYNGYLFLIRNTKEGEIKQSLTLYGKDSLEKIISSIENDEIKYNEGKLKFTENIILDEIVNNKEEFVGTVYLDEKYQLCDIDSAKYKEIITLSKVKLKKDNSQLVGEEIELNTDSTNFEECYKIDMASIFDTLNNNTILNIYIENNNEIILKNVEKDEEVSVNISNNNMLLDFSKYEKDEIDRKININIYNRDDEYIPEIYINNSENLYITIKALDGNVRIYGEKEVEKPKKGVFYNIKIKILDSKDNSKEFFITDEKQNIDIN